MSYHPFKSAGGEDYGSFEAFEVEAEDADEVNPAGWYWQACFPGCLPDGDPEGPFGQKDEAIANAEEWY